MSKSEDVLPNMELGVLHDRLDELWTRYLDLIDQYQTAQKQIQTNMASGMMSLAQANFQSRNRRYGQDYFDQRAVATTRATIVSEDNHDRIRIHTLEVAQASDSSTEDQSFTVDSSPGFQSKENEGTPPADQSSLLTPEPTPEPDVQHEIKGISSLPANEAFPDINGKSDPPDPETRPSRDPIRQFGILVPPALRAAQASFSAAMQDEQSIAQAIHTVRLMREVETDIRKLRKSVRKAERTASDRTAVPL